jgi:hypothetical protein
MVGCPYCLLNYQPYLTMTEYNGLHMVGKVFFPVPNLDGLGKCCP